MSDKVIETIKKAQELIANGWTQGEMARNASGKGVDVFSKKATCFCALGALMRSAPDQKIYDRAISLFYIKRYVTLVDWNDNQRRTKEEVLAKFNAVLEKLTNAHK